MKLEILNYHPKTTKHAKLYLDPTTLVVWANTRFATVWLLCSSFMVSSSRAQVAPVDRFRRFIVYTLYHVLSRKDVPFRGCVNTYHLMG